MKKQSSGGKKAAAGQSGTTRPGSNSCGKTQAEQRLRRRRISFWRRINSCWRTDGRKTLPLVVGKTDGSVSREYLIAGKIVGSVSREYRQQGNRAAGKIVSRAASSAGQIGRWLRRQGRSATSGRCIDADDISRRCIGEDVSAQTIYREDVSAKIGSRAPNRHRIVRLREQRAASQGSRAASLAGQITPSTTSVAGRQVGVAGRRRAMLRRARQRRRARRRRAGRRRGGREDPRSLS